MAAEITKPILPLEIWAESDQVLPNSGRLNKLRPIDDLWQKGWDKGQKPDCEGFNYLLNLYGQWIQYIVETVDTEPSFLEKAENLADVLDKAAARTHLDVYSKAEAANAFVDVTGDTMTGPLSLGRINFTGTYSTDSVYMECSYLGEESSHLDFVFGDNVTEGQIRFRCKNTASNGSIFNIMTIEGKDALTGRVDIYNELHVSGSISTGALSATTGDFTNTNVSGTGTFGTIRCHDTTINSGGTTTNYTRVNGDCNVNNLVVNNDWAVVAGKHIVRSVNGTGADANGNVIIASGVQDIRFGGVITRGYYNHDWAAPVGEVMVGCDVDPSTAVLFYTRKVQKLIDGVWYNVGE